MHYASSQQRPQIPKVGMKIERWNEFGTRLSVSIYEQEQDGNRKKTKTNPSIQYKSKGKEQKSKVAKEQHPSNVAPTVVRQVSEEPM